MIKINEPGVLEYCRSSRSGNFWIIISSLQAEVFNENQRYLMKNIVPLKWNIHMYILIEIIFHKLL